MVKFGASQVAQWQRIRLAMQETWVQSLGQEDPLEKEMANPVQYSSLGSLTDRGARWAAAHGVAKESDTT